MSKFLNERKHIYEKLKAGVEHHASDAELSEFKTLADKISPNNKFEYIGCFSCAQHLMKFVFDNQEKLNKKTNEKTI